MSTTSDDFQKRVTELSTLMIDTVGGIDKEFLSLSLTDFVKSLTPELKEKIKSVSTATTFQQLTGHERFEDHIAHAFRDHTTQAAFSLNLLRKDPVATLRILTQEKMALNDTLDNFKDIFLKYTKPEDDDSNVFNAIACLENNVLPRINGMIDEILEDHNISRVSIAPGKDWQAIGKLDPNDFPEP